MPSDTDSTTANKKNTIRISLIQMDYDKWLHKPLQVEFM